MKACDRFVLCQLISDWEKRESVSAGNPSVMKPQLGPRIAVTSIHPSKVGKPAGDTCGFRYKVYESYYCVCVPKNPSVFQYLLNSHFHIPVSLPFPVSGLSPQSVLLSHILGILCL